MSVSLCFVNKLICIIILDSTYNWYYIFLWLASLIWYSLGPSTLLQMALFHSFLWLSSIPLYIYVPHFILSFKLFIILFHHLFPLPCCVFIYSTNTCWFPLCVRHWWYSGKQDIYSVSERRWGVWWWEWVGVGTEKSIRKTPEILNMNSQNMNSQPGAFLTLAKHVWTYTQ